MQAMSDKDFNELFQRKFEGHKVEPAAAVWAGINAELNKNKQKKPFQVLWMAAASIIVAVCAGLYLLQPQEVIRLQGKAEPQIMKQEVITETPASIITEPEPLKELAAGKETAPVAKVSRPQVRPVTAQSQTARETAPVLA